MDFNILPTGVAIFTRGVERNYDYNWYIKVGSIRLYNSIEELHKVTLRDKESDDIPLLLALIKPQKKRIGIVLAQIPSPRVNHVPRIIYNALYLEFELEEQGNILKVVATLLTCLRYQYTEYQQYLSEYSEKLYLLGQNFLQPLCLQNDLVRTQLKVCRQRTYIDGIVSSEEKSESLYRDFQDILQKTILPISNNLDKELLGTDLLLFEQNRLAVPNNVSFRKRCASYLLNKIFDEESLCIISTKEVDIEKCYQIAKGFDRCIILNQSVDIQEEIRLENGSPIIETFNRIKKNVINYLR